MGQWLGLKHDKRQIVLKRRFSALFIILQFYDHPLHLVPLYLPNTLY